MLCPVCHPNNLCMSGSAMNTPCEAHQTPDDMLSAAKFPSLITFDPEKLGLAIHLTPMLPLDCSVAFEACREAAVAAFAEFKDLTTLHNSRYKAMCPADSNGESNARSHMHASSVDHLRNWPGVLIEGPLAVALVPKIPAEILAFTVQKKAYESYAQRFEGRVNAFIDGVYSAFLCAKIEVQDAIWKSDLCEMNLRMWQRFWDRFVNENDKWEDDFIGLTLPAYEEILSELHLAILEGVEGAENPESLIHDCDEEEPVEKESDNHDDADSFSSYDEVYSILGAMDEDVELL